MRPKDHSSLYTAREIMDAFAEVSGIATVGDVPRRYLWTDAFAVCNYLGLYQETGDVRYKTLAVALIDQVHAVLGRHRDDDTRTGWISGLDKYEGERHPTKGGLRIGKNLSERGLSEPFVESLEWDRDGQYFHYLTKWMHALHRAARITGDPAYSKWALELAKTVHAGFTYLPSPGGLKYMYWKMSIDLSRPQITSMGQHDPLDGLITYHQVQTQVPGDTDRSRWPDLTDEIADMVDICRGKSWTTDDPLGLGGMLWDAYKTAQLIVDHHFEGVKLLNTLLDAALSGLATYKTSAPWELPSRNRLAFRELGLTIGLRAAEKLQEWIRDNPFLPEESGVLRSHIDALTPYLPLIEKIENFWCDPDNRKTPYWLEHGDINGVMLATSLAPDGFLMI